MSGVLQIKIAESEETLKELLAKQKTAKTKARVQVLYWLKTKQAETVEHLATLAGHHRTTISRWLSQYRKGGIKTLLNIKTSPGRTPSVPRQIREMLREKLIDSPGFSSYKEIQMWLKAICDLDVSYAVVHKLVRYRLKGKLRVSRSVNCRQKNLNVVNIN